MEELTPRQQSILGVVIRSYISNPQPVSSKALLEHSSIDVSSATVRNEMAALEAKGFLTHPHTSAGRQPTDAGYRYFVERLLGEVELPLEERNTIRHQFHQSKLEVGAWMNLAAAVMARSVRSAAVITAPKIENPRLRTIQLISIQSTTVLLVLVMQGGTVRQQMVQLREPADQNLLTQSSNRLNNLFAGRDEQSVKTHRHELSELEQTVLAIVMALMQTDGPSNSEVVRDGLTEVLQEPEFRAQADARALVNALESRGLLDEIHDSRVGTVRVVIGGEGRWRELSSCSVVLARYGMEGFATGTLGVVGPTRMPYGRAIGTVRYLSELMSDLVTDTFGE